MGLFGFGKKKDLKKKEDLQKKEEATPVLKSMTEQLGYSYHVLSEDLSLDKVMDIYLEVADSLWKSRAWYFWWD